MHTAWSENSAGPEHGVESAQALTIGQPSTASPKWQRALFEFFQRNARSLPGDLEIRPEHRVELGLSVEL